MAFISSIPVSFFPKVSSSQSKSFHRFPIRLPTHCPTHLPDLPKQTSPQMQFQQPLQTGYGQSTDPSTSTAIKEAIDTALKTVPTPAVALITCAVSRDPSELYEAAADHLRGVAIHGATTCAAPLTREGSLPGGVSVLLLGGAGIIAGGAGGNDGVEVGMKAAELVAERMGGKDRVQAVIMQATPGIEEAVIEGVGRVLGKAVDVFGGSAADDTVEGGWRVLTSDGGVFESGVALVGIAKGVGFGSCMVAPYAGGELGGVVTKAEGRTVYEIDGRNASHVLGEWVGDGISDQVKEGGGVIVECASFPLGVKRDGGWLAIHCASIGEDDSVGLFAQVEVGERLVVMSKDGGEDSVKAAKMGLEKAYTEAIRKGGLEKVSAGLMVYCGGLSIAVGDRLNESLEGLKDKVPLMGMTVFGEQGRVGAGNLHSNLAVGVALFE